MKKILIFSLVFLFSIPIIYSQNGTITTRVWNDLDGDGKQDGNENLENIENVTVKLLLPNNSVVATTTTNASGIATFSEPAGTYKLQYTLPNDHAFTLKDNANNNEDSDADQGNGRTASFELIPGGLISGVDAGMWAPGTVKARVWNDLDGDGKQDGNENLENLDGVTVKLLRANNSLITSAVTDANGIATIENVPADEPVKLQFVTPGDHAFTLKDVGNNSQDSDADQGNGRTATFQASKGSQTFTSVDAGMWAPGTVKARVWNDLDGDGKQDGNESAANLSGVTVNLLRANNSFLASGVTDANGIATINNVPADEPVKLQFELPGDHAYTLKDVGNNSQDSDADTGNGRTATFQATKGSQTFTSVDAGMWAPGTVVARVWDDLDGDGKQDGNESAANISGVTVKLLRANNSLISTAITDINGLATISNVPADEPVKLQFVTLDDHAFTLKDAGNNDQDSDADQGNGRTATFQATKGSQTFTNVDAGMWAPGTVVARVWDDLDGDGKQDGNESAANVSGITVNLLRSNNNFITSAVTNNSGLATLTGVPADEAVKLQFVLPADHAFTLKDAGNNDQDSDADQGNGRTATFQATKGSQTFTNVDAGMWTPGVARARIWMDTDGDGKQDGNESSGNNNVFGFRVNLLNQNNSPVMHKGKAVYALSECGTGEAVIDYVPADRPVKLQFIRFDNAVFTQKDATNDNQDSDADVNNGRTATFQADRGSDLHTSMDAGLTDRGDWDDASATTYVWNDKNGDGKQNDGGGVGIENVTVYITDKSGANCYCEKTGANGQAVIPAIGGNEYRLKYIVPTDHKLTLQNKGGDDNKDSDAKQSNGLTHKFNLAAGQNITNVDGGLWAPGTVETYVWNDKNGDGKQNDGGGVGIAGVTVQLTESNGSTVLATTTTGANGVAIFNDVPADRDLKLKYTTPADHKLTLHNKGGDDNKDSDANQGNGITHKFKASKGSHLRKDVDAGLWAPGTVETYVWNDKNGDGKQNDGGGVGIGGVTVLLTESNGSTVLATATTGANGVAIFNDVPADRDLKLKYFTPADHKLTLQNKGGDDNKDSDANQGNGITHKFKASKGSHLRKDVDAGLWAPGTVETYVWNDKNGDGKQNDGGGVGIAGVKVQLTESDGSTVLDTKTTGANGVATFNNVPADRDLKLKYFTLIDHKLTKHNQGGDDNKDSDANQGNGITHKFKASKGSHLRKDVDAGMWAPGTVETFVWNDSNGDGKQNDGGGSGLSGVTVELTESNGSTVIATAVTGANGVATFNNVPADRDLRLKYTVPGDYELTLQNQGGDDNKDSDPNKNTGITHKFKASKGSHLRKDVDAGMIYIANNFRTIGNENQFMETFSIDYTMHPVPASNWVNINLESTVDAQGKYYIIDALGKLVAQNDINIRKGINRYEVDLSNVPGGNYYFQVRTEDMLITKAFTVAKY